MPARLPIEVQATPQHFLGMPPARFLRDYWQKRPLLVRSAFPGFEAPLAPDDLAGLACMDGALARIVSHDTRRDRWALRTGPFDEATFAQLPESNWTLLVQDVDKWDADTAALLDHFAFIPSWRIDDIMISYATDAGGVGAHVDQYDVFLVQGLGQRHWGIDAGPNPPTAFRDDVELKLLKSFTSSHAWTLDPGDMLYLPPGVPHDGAAVGECMTYSIGMRAPAAAEMLMDMAHVIAAELPDEQRYGDADLAPAQQSGEIDAAALVRARRSVGVLAGALDDDAFADWFGCFITRYRMAQVPLPRKRPIDAARLPERLARSVLVRDAWSRFAWRRRGRNAVVYAAGEAFPAPTAWAAALGGRERVLDGGRLLELPQRQAGLRLLAALINAGHMTLRVH
ncbi:MAG TPA: cupin domain-containing protein [Rhodanobacteraceae bacterium]|nr:cupin domain-containing protein [Rhodanobacteraceae bacterium]